MEPRIFHRMFFDKLKRLTNQAYKLSSTIKYSGEPIELFTDFLGQGLTTV